MRGFSASSTKEAGTWGHQESLQHAAMQHLALQHPSCVTKNGAFHFLVRKQEFFWSLLTCQVLDLVVQNRLYPTLSKISKWCGEMNIFRSIDVFSNIQMSIRAWRQCIIYYSTRIPGVFRFLISGSLTGTNHYFFIPLGRVNKMKAELSCSQEEPHKHKEVPQWGAQTPNLWWLFKEQ